MGPKLRHTAVLPAVLDLLVTRASGIAEADVGASGALAKKKAEAEAARLAEEEQKRQAAEKQAKRLKCVREMP